MPNCCRAAVLAVMSVLSTTAIGCYRTRHHPPPSVPASIAPNIVVEGTPGPGLTRVVLDVADGPALVERVQGGSLAGAAGSSTFGASLSLSRNVCVTPCVFDTAPGVYELRFTSLSNRSRTSRGFINVGLERTAYRHALGTRRNKAWKGFVGWPIVGVGGLVGLASLGMNDREFYSGADQVRGLAVGAGLTILGAWLVHGAVIDDQPGSGAQWLVK